LLPHSNKDFPPSTTAEEAAQDALKAIKQGKTLGRGVKAKFDQ